jgi:hypothetical protein
MRRRYNKPVAYGVVIALLSIIFMACERPGYPLLFELNGKLLKEVKINSNGKELHIEGKLYTGDRKDNAYIKLELAESGVLGNIISKPDIELELEKYSDVKWSTGSRIGYIEFECSHDNYRKMEYEEMKAELAARRMKITIINISDDPIILKVKFDIESVLHTYAGLKEIN